jgi:RHS repeat-associated protein
MNNTGDLPYSTSVGSDTEHVELSSGNLIVNIPFIGVPGRKMSFNFGIRYDARFWVQDTAHDGTLFWNPEQRNWLTTTTLGWTPTQGYQTYKYGSASCLENDGNEQTNTDGTATTFYNAGGTQGSSYLFTDNRGVKHSFLISHFYSGECLQTSPGGTFDSSNYVGPSADMDGWYGVANANASPAAVYSPDGTTYGSGGTSGGTTNYYLGSWFVDYAGEYDLRGNHQVVSPGGVDSTGRTPITEQNNGNQIVYTTHDSNGSPQTYTVNLQTITVSTQFGFNGIQEYSANRQVVSSVVLPNQQSYSFQYDAWGEITQMTLPTGAVINYQWTTLNLPTAPGLRSVTQRSVTHDGKTDTWNFAYTSVSAAGGGSNGLVTVTDPPDAHGVSAQTVYTYDPYQHLAKVQYLASPSGSQLLEYDMTWDTTRVSPDGTQAENSLMTSLTTTLENGLVSQKKFQYDLYAYQYQTLNCSDFTGGGWMSCIDLSNGDTEINGAVFVPTAWSWLPPPAWEQGSHGNVTAIQEYDWGQGAPGPLMRQTIRKYLQDTTPNYFVASVPPGSSPVPAVSNIADRVVSETVYDGSTPCNGTGTWVGDGNGSIAPPPSCGANVVAQTAVAYDNSNPASYGYYGEATSISHWLNTTNSFLTTSYTYDSYGNIVSVTDPNGNTSHFGYSDAWAGSSACSTGSAANAYLTSVTNALGQQHQQTYFQCTGKLANHQDANDLANNDGGTSFYYDLLGRQTLVTYPDGGQTSTAYNDSSNTVDVQTLINAGQTHDALTLLDQLGRKIQTQLRSDPSGTDYTDTTYDALGRVNTVSNPYRSTADATYGLTQAFYDARGRKVQQVNPDNTTLSWTYTGNMTDSLDENNTHMQHTTDALGRLVKVMELGTSTDPRSLETDYTYNTLGDLTNVNQHGASGETPRTRSFTYDSLSRLITSQNPETGTICYGMLSSGSCQNGYDANSNLLAKTDANGVTMSYSYDPLNRLTSKSSSDGSVTDGYVYDQTGTGPNAVGRLSFVHNGSATGTGLFYDPMGRVLRSSFLVPGVSGWQQGTRATYDLAGNPTSIAYNDGRSVTQAYDAAGRITSVTDASSGTAYFSGATYTAAGALASATYGNGVTESIQYNTRLQPCHASANSTALVSISGVGNLFDRTSSYANSPSNSSPCNSEPGNNGNIAYIADNRNVNWTQSFAYDGLNRLLTASRSDGGYNHTYNYDSFGNLIIQDNINPGPTYTINPSTNQLNRLANNVNIYNYDNAGNLLSTGTSDIAGHSYTYNALSQITAVDGGATGSYVYNGLDERAYKSTASGSTSYAYFNGQPIAEYTSDGTWTDYIYAGQKIAKVTSNEDRIHLSGTNCSSCGNQFTLFNMPLPNYTLQSGDTLFVSQYSAGSRGGLQLQLSGTNKFLQGNDSDGDNLLDDTVQNQWHHRTFAIPSGDVGLSLVSGGLTVNSRTPAGPWNMYFRDIVIVQANGTVVPLYNSGTSLSLTASPTSGVTGVSGVTEVGVPLASQAEDIHYYLDDHLGTTQVELADGGWPLWQGQFTPFGAELPDGSTTMHYKFTGKERDQETGLDFFGARYYASANGRWMSPDWAERPEAVPYSSLPDPQSLNLYGYAGNNPLSQADADGHDWRDRGFSFKGLGGKIASAWHSFQQHMQDGFQNLANQTASGMLHESNNDPYAGAELAIGAGAGAATPVGPAEGGTISGTVEESVEPEATLSTSVIEDSTLTERANAIQSAQSTFGQDKSTTAAASVTDANGNTSIMIGSSRNALTPSQRGALQPGETAVTGPGHAETTVINAAQSQGMTVNAVAASRPICATCAQAIQDAGARQVTADKPQ